MIVEHACVYTMDTSGRITKVRMQSPQMSIAIVSSYWSHQIKHNVQIQQYLSLQLPNAHLYRLGLALPKYFRSAVHLNGPNLARSSRNWVILTVLGSLQGLISQEDWILDFGPLSTTLTSHYLPLGVILTSKLYHCSVFGRVVMVYHLLKSL